MKSIRILCMLLTIMVVACASWAAQSQPTIQGFYHNTTGWLTAYDTLEVVMEGSANGTASFEIPGVNAPIRMEWGSDQRYTGTWTVPENIRNLQGAKVVGILRVGSVSLFAQCKLPVNIDTTPPSIMSLWPVPGSIFARATPGISAVYDDSTGSGVAPNYVKLTVDGVDVTDQASVGARFVNYRPATPLEPGVKTVVLSLEDKARNFASKTWSFTVGEAVETIKSINYSAPPTVGPGDVISVRMEGQSGGKASYWFVVPGVSTLGQHPMKETSPGVYQATYKVRQGTDLRGARVVGSLATSGGTYSLETDKELSGKPVQLVPPRITTPKSSAGVASPLVASGKTVPMGRVRLVLTYTTRGLGGKWMDGILSDQMVTADGQGRFRSAPVKLGALLPRNTTRYTLKAYAVGFDGSESKPKVVRFKRK